MGNFLRNAIIWIIFAVPAVSLIVAMNMIFPFITGKAFLFRVAVELSFFLYIALAVSDKSYRPKWNALTIAFASFTTVMLLANIFAPDPYKAFWSNFERMDGFVTLAHLFVYFIVASSVLRRDRDWELWKLFTIAASIFMLYFSFLQLSGEAVINQGGVRVDGSLGNASYLAVYLVFHFFFLLYLWQRGKFEFRNIATSLAVGSVSYTIYYLWRIAQPGGAHTAAGIIIFSLAALLSFFAIFAILSKKIIAGKDKIIRHSVFVLITTSYLVVLYHTATRGAIIGLIGGVFVGAVYLAIKERSNMLVRNASVAIFLGITVIAGGFYFAKDRDFIRNNSVLSRFATVSWVEAKEQARNYVWPMAIKGFLERPIIGWGQEGFNYVFYKYYVPEMITQEPWFDRAHNSFLDWLVAGGILGFLSYFSLYVIALLFIFKSANFTSRERAALIALFVAYSFQNLFIFDNLLSYILFVSFLAMLSSHYNRKPGDHSSYTFSNASLNPVVLACSLVLFVVVALLINAKPYLQNITLIKALSPQKGGVEENLKLFQKAIKYNSFGTYEARQQLYDLSLNFIASDAISKETRAAYIREVIKESEKQSKETPHDVKWGLIYGSYLNTVGFFDAAIDILEKMRNISPKKQQVLYELAKAYYVKGFVEKNDQLKDKGLAIAEYAYKLYPDPDLVKMTHVAFLLAIDKVDDAVLVSKEIKDINMLVDYRVIQPFTNNGYVDYAEDFLKKTIEINPTNADAYIFLSNLYILLENKDLALSTLDRLAEVIPSFQDEVTENKKIVEESFK